MTKATVQNPALTNPALTRDVLERLIAGEALIEPRMAAAVAVAEATGMFECPYCHGVNDGVPRIMSSGMGVESAAIQVVWLVNPSSRDFCLCQLTILTAQTGDENADTGLLMDKYLLPLYRYFMIRFVEVARAGELEKEGIVILQDSRTPDRVHLEGAYKLSDHLKRSGTVPQFGGEHRCSLKQKAYPNDFWLTNCFGAPNALHAFGYNSAEPARAQRCDAAIEVANGRASRVEIAFGYNSAEGDRAEKSDEAYARRNVVRVGFGFNSEEEGRAERASDSDGERACARMAFGYNDGEVERADRTAKHDTVFRVGFYPLIEWAKAARSFAVAFPRHWLAFAPAAAGIGSRPWCEFLLFETFGVEWKKSACVFCPFNREASKETEAGLARFRQHPEQTAEALVLEYGSLCLNPRGALYNTKTLHAVVLNSDQAEALEIFERKLDSTEFALSEVKRIYSGPGAAARSVIQIARGTRAEMGRLFDQYAEELSLQVKTERGIRYAYFAERGEQYPAVEGFLVVAPAYIESKVRGQFKVFEERFARAAEQTGLSVRQTPGSVAVNNQGGQPSLFLATAGARADERAQTRA
jgi:hypothetical protein